MNEIKEVFAKISEEVDAMTKTIEYQRVILDRLNQQPVCPYTCRDAAVPTTVYPKRSLNDSTWDEIAMLSQSGMADKMFAVGDTKEVKLDNGSAIHVRIIGFNHDESDIGLPLGITFETVETLNKDYQMNAKNTNAGGWEKSTLRKTLNGDFLDTVIPCDLHKHIKPCAKLTYSGDKLGKSIDKLFLLSEQEVFGRKIWSNGGEGRWYDWYRRENVDYWKAKQNGERDWLWERSPGSSDATGFCCVGSGGSASGNGAGAARGVAFGFCI